MHCEWARAGGVRVAGMISNRIRVSHTPFRRAIAARLTLAALAAVTLLAATGARSRAMSGWTHEATAKPVPTLYPGFGSAIAANDVGLVAM